MLFKNNSLDVILHAAKTEIDTMLLRLSNLNCVNLFVGRQQRTEHLRNGKKRNQIYKWIHQI